MKKSEKAQVAVIALATLYFIGRAAVSVIWGV